MKVHETLPPILDITEAGFTIGDVLKCREDIQDAVSKGLFVLATVPDSMKVTDIKNEGKCYTFSMVYQGAPEVKAHKTYFIPERLQFLFSFYESKEDSRIVAFSTNMSSMLFKELMVMCGNASMKLSAALSETDYRVVGIPADPDGRKTLTDIKAQQNPKKVLELVNALVMRPYMCTEAQQEKNEPLLVFRTNQAYKNYRKLKEEDQLHVDLKSALEGNAALESKRQFREAYHNPLLPAGMAYVAYCELFQILREHDVFDRLPKDPCIVDVGGAGGLNAHFIAACLKAVGLKPHVLNIDPGPDSVKCSLSMEVPAACAYLEDVAFSDELQETTDLAMVFHANVIADTNKFCQALHAILRQDKRSRLVIGFFIGDLGTERVDGVLKNLRLFFDDIKALSVTEGRQVLYTASPKPLEQLPALTPKMQAYQDDMHKKVGALHIGSSLDPDSNTISMSNQD